MQKIRKQEKGFTIIEVLIVLAIAALIMLIVFLAVPALQRNSRNNGRRNDAGRIGATANEYVANNNGQAPPDTAAGEVDLRNDVGDMAQYDDANLSIATGDQGVVGDIADIVLVVGAECDDGNAGETNGASAREMAVQYRVETAGGSDPQCQNV